MGLNGDKNHQLPIYIYGCQQDINMSKREQEKTAEATQRVAEEAKNLAQSQIGQQQAVAQEFQSTINRSLDEVRKSIDETRNQIPQYTTPGQLHIMRTLIECSIIGILQEYQQRYGPEQ